MDRLSSEVAVHRSERSRVRAAYNILAWDAEVSPSPDQKLRGSLKGLVDSLLSVDQKRWDQVEKVVADDEVARAIRDPKK